MRIDVCQHLLLEEEVDTGGARSGREGVALQEEITTLRRALRPTININQPRELIYRGGEGALAPILSTASKNVAVPAFNAQKTL